MTFASNYTPAQSIRVKTLGLHWREGRLLAAEVRDRHDVLTGVRPLGGTVEFGETWSEALKREFHEELGVAISISGLPLFFENLFTMNDVAGHEILIVADVAFDASKHDIDAPLEFLEDGGQRCVARWWHPDDLKSRCIPLFPEALWDHIGK